MPPNKIVLLPATHEQTLPTFHVPASLEDAFLMHLEARGIKVTQPPEALGASGPDDTELRQIEVDFAADPVELEAVLADFWRDRGSDS